MNPENTFSSKQYDYECELRDAKKIRTALGNLRAAHAELGQTQYASSGSEYFKLADMISNLSIRASKLEAKTEIVPEVKTVVIDGIKYKLVRES